MSSSRSRSLDNTCCASTSLPSTKVKQTVAPSSWFIDRFSINLASSVEVVEVDIAVINYEVVGDFTLTSGLYENDLGCRQKIQRDRSTQR